MKRTALRKQSPKQRTKNAEWAELKRARMDEQYEARDYCWCEYPDCRFRCSRWEAPGRLQADHIVHRSLGGKNEATNLRLLCPAHHWFVHSAEGLKEARG